MKPLIFVMLVFSASAFAQQSVEEYTAGLKKGMENSIYSWTTSHEFKGLPNDEYIKFTQNLWDAYESDLIKFKKSACGRGKTDCLSEADENAIKSQVRIEKGLLTARNNWSRDKVSDTEIAKRAQAYTDCAKENKNCDKLPETDKKTAREGQPDKPTVVTPGGDGKTGTDVEVVTPGKDDGDRKPADVDTKKFDEAKKVAEDELKKEIDDLDKAFSDKNPGWRDKEMTPEVKNFLLSQMNKNLELNLAMSKKLCEQFPGSEACLTDEQIEKLKEENAGNLCFIERKFATKSVEASKHSTDWDELPKPKSCKTLMDKDKDAPKNEPKKDEPVTIEDGDDEKTPRNYKSETCKWVGDLPRKIVNGPGCGGKSRSRICTGYVVCEQKQGGGKFIRMSSCSPEHCGTSDADAVKCTKDMHYYSQKPAGEAKLFMSPKLKKILSGASEQ